MSEHAGENLARLMADQGLSIHQVAEKCGLDNRTIRGVLANANKPHARTLHCLARGLRVSIDEFFLDPSRLLYRHFDRHTNPVVQQVIDARGELFDGWGESDFNELHSRVGTGGCLTFDGAVAAAEQMNRKRDLHEKLDVLLETSQSELIASILEVLYGQAVVRSE